MRVVFDQQVFLLQEYGGISRYICSLAKHLVGLSDVDARIVAPLHFNRALATLKEVRGPRALMPSAAKKAFRLIAPTSKYIARKQINCFQPQIVHETYFSFDDYRPRGAKRVVTVYDMIHERYADTFERSHMTSGPKRAAVTRADHVICISENTQRDLIELMGVPVEKTSVVHLAADEVFYDNSANRINSDMAVDSPFLLYVGSRAGYKNFKGFIEAVGSSAYLKSNFMIVCFGGGALHSAELELLVGCGLRIDQVKQISGSDDVLADLYRRAAAFIYPSLYEGFGIPPLEAMASGCPVICSDSSSLPEVVGDAGEYFDPRNNDSMVHALEQVLQSSTRRKELVQKGLHRCATYSWSRCASETLTQYQRLM